MRITVVSRSWPSHERSGVSLAAFSHARILLEQGHEVSIIGAMDDLKSLSLPLANRALVQAFGSGSLYSPTHIDDAQLKKAIVDNNPDLVIVEAWQTAITDGAIEVAHELDIPVLMISHGISLHPYRNSLAQFARSLAWLPYRYFKLPRLMKKLSAITTLDEHSTSSRFFDRDLAIKLGISVWPLKNFPAHQFKTDITRTERKMEIVVVGYFSAVKNQLAAIDLLSKLPKNISCCFIGDRHGDYFEFCQKKVAELGLEKRIFFKQDNECNLAEEIAKSILVFLPSITEALPMTLIEAMACGTPFVATSVGAIPSFSGGILADDEPSQMKAIHLLIDHPDLWQRYSDAGKCQYKSEFTEEHMARQLAQVVEMAILQAHNSNITHQHHRD